MIKIKYKVNNKLGYFGDSDLKKKIIVINKKIHKKAKKKSLFGIPKKDATILNTIVHEEMHIKHPKRHEVNVRKMTQRFIKSLTSEQKKSYYRKLS